MNATLHLQPLPEPDVGGMGKIETVFFVIQRANGHWSPGAKIITVTEHEDIAEAMAAEQKRLHPQQAFGVFMLRSEARTVANPIEIVRTEGNA